MMTAGLLLAAGCGDGSDTAAGGATEEHNPAVRVAPVGRADVHEEIVYTADLKAGTAVKVYSPVTDRVLQFPYENGDVVAKGQRLAVVRRDGLDKGLAQIAAQIEGLEVQLAQAQADLTRNEGLAQRGVITPQMLDQSRTAYLSNKAQLEATQASFEQMSVTAAEAEIKAPIGGVIAAKTLQSGDMASMQLPLCTVMNVDPLKIELRLTERDVARVQVGQDVAVTLDSYRGQTFHGELTRVLPYLDGATRTDTAEVLLANPVDEETGERRLKPGMFGRASLVVDQREQVVVAPQSALLLDPQLLALGSDATLRKAYVVDEEGIAHERLVTVGLRQGDTCEVIDGLEESDRLVVRGQHGLDDGQRVQVVQTVGEAR